MTRDELNSSYFDWMCDFVYDDRISTRLSYETLLTRLHETDFEYILPMDGNRASDGVNLRYRFGYENHYPDPMIAAYLDDRPCSVLEMMIALSLRCEEAIMCDPDIGDRTGQWFWSMIVSLGLGRMSDAKFDEDEFQFVMERFMRREYDRNGKGGLFTVEHHKQNMKTVDIWYQMNYYLDEIIQ